MLSHALRTRVARLLSQKQKTSYKIRIAPERTFPQRLTRDGLRSRPLQLEVEFIVTPFPRQTRGIPVVQIPAPLGELDVVLRIRQPLFPQPVAVDAEPELPEGHPLRLFLVEDRVSVQDGDVLPPRPLLQERYILLYVGDHVHLQDLGQ